MESLKILVAEDNAINQKLILRLFKILGYTIHIASDGHEVIDILSRIKIDLIFMDIQMPGMDGFEATSEIRKRWGNQKPFIVAMTANALNSDKDKCLEVGMDDFLSKPLIIEQLKTGIDKWSTIINSRK